MRLLTHTVTPQEAGLPVRTLLRRQLRISGSFLAKLKWRPGAITLNGIPVIVSTRTEAGDVLAADVSDLPGENPHIRPVAYPLDILWEDEDLLLLNKPAGIAIHPSALTEETVTVAGAVCHYLRTGSFHCVNRLDRGTTGVMAVAKTGYIHRLCMESLHTDSFLREYRGICLERLSPPPAALICPSAGTPALCSAAPWTLWAFPPERSTRPCCRGSCLCCGCCPRRAAPTSCGSTSPPWATRWLGTGSTAPRTPPSSPVRRCTPTVSGSCTP